MVQVKYHLGDEFEFEMNGHAGFDIKGKDIVCAAASSITITSFNAIEKFIDDNDYQLIEKDGYLLLKVHNRVKEVELLFDNLVETLQELESQFPKNIKITK